MICVGPTSIRSQRLATIAHLMSKRAVEKFKAITRGKPTSTSLAGVVAVLQLLRSELADPRKGGETICSDADDWGRLLYGLETAIVAGGAAAAHANRFEELR
jgi:hypothetical protein